MSVSASCSQFQGTHKGSIASERMSSSSCSGSRRKMGETGTNIRLLDLSPEILARIVSHVSEDFRDMGPLMMSCRALKKAAQTATINITVFTSNLKAARALKEAKMIMAFAPTLKGLCVFEEGGLASYVLSMGWHFKSLRELQIGNIECTDLAISAAGSMAATLRVLDLTFSEYHVENFNFYLSLLCRMELHPECDTGIDVSCGSGNYGELSKIESGTDFSQLASLPSLINITVRSGCRIMGLTALKALPKLDYVDLCSCALKRSDLMGFASQAPALTSMAVIGCIDFERGRSIDAELDEIKSGLF